MSLPEENTLGVLFTGRRVPDATRRVIRAAAPRRSTLGTGFIAVGATIIFALRALYGLVWFATSWTVYPSLLPALAAWGLLIITVIVTLLISRLHGDRLPRWLYLLFVFGMFGTVALDLWAIWPLGNIGAYATAAVTAGMAFIVIATLRSSIDVLWPVAAVGVAFAVSIALNSPLDAEHLPAQITALALTVLPPVIAVALVRGFRRLVQIELDRVLVQSTVSAPRFAVGLMESEELARLDLAAEELLESVASNRTTLPLTPATASVAASLATELRLHLIEGRRQTWLYHAITESDLLGKSVNLVDRAGLAGLLEPEQRDGLLSAAWLLVSDSVRTNSPRTIEIVVGPTDPGTGVSTRTLTVPITITSTGVRRHGVDPAIWDALRSVGEYTDTTRNETLRVTIRCQVQNPAET